MARISKNNVDYFPHPVKNGKKMKYMMDKYKNLGYSSWYQLLEELGDAEYHYIDLSDEVELMLLSSKLLTDEETLISIINDLVKLKAFDKELWEDYRVIFSQKFVDDIEDAYKRRNNKCVTLESLCKHLKIKCKHNECINKEKESKHTQSKVKESKVKESKVKESKVKESKGNSLSLEEKNLVVKNEILNSHSWIDAQMKVHKLDEFTFKEKFQIFWLEKYEGHNLENMPKKITEIKQHFNNWIQKKKENGNSKKPSSRIEQFFGED